MKTPARILVTIALLALTGWHQAAGADPMVNPTPSDIWIKAAETHPGEPIPLLVFLHGMGSSPQELEPAFRKLAESGRFSIFLPCGRVKMEMRPDGNYARNWDVKKDARTIIRKIKKRKEINNSPVIIAGFSAGASMSILTGIEDPDLFTGVIAFSGALEINLLSMSKAEKAASKLPIVLVHGTRDPIMTVSLGRIARAWLEEQEFRVRLMEFDGGHVIPSKFGEIIEEALAWMELPSAKN